ncbi:MAG: hypothetical protein IPL86_16430 [Flavobacteriales bacterium]|nr:hypothetical protein [Flavobacteriales bacterium]
MSDVASDKEAFCAIVDAYGTKLYKLRVGSIDAEFSVAQEPGLALDDTAELDAEGLLQKLKEREYELDTFSAG